VNRAPRAPWHLARATIDGMQRSAGEPDNFYAVPELAAHYDADNAGRPDLPFYLRLAGRIAARRVVDIGSGTGLLCRSLAARGHEVIGVEPQLTMLDIARRRPGASAVAWVRGAAGDLPAGWAELAVMTGHVAQYFLDDEAWRLVLTQSRRSLRPGGHLAFEIRNASLDEWRTWASDEPGATSAGTVRADVHRAGDLVTHTDHWVQHDREWTTRETLRFPSWEDVTRGLATTGFVVEESWGDWTGEPITPRSPEWIILARAAGAGDG